MVQGQSNKALLTYTPKRGACKQWVVELVNLQSEYGSGIATKMENVFTRMVASDPTAWNFLLTQHTSKPDQSCKIESSAQNTSWRMNLEDDASLHQFSEPTQIELNTLFNRTVSPQRPPLPSNPPAVPTHPSNPPAVPTHPSNLPTDLTPPSNLPANLTLKNPKQIIPYPLSPHSNLVPVHEQPTFRMWPHPIGPLAPQLDPHSRLYSGAEKINVLPFTQNLVDPLQLSLHQPILDQLTPQALDQISALRPEELGQLFDQVGHWVRNPAPNSLFIRVGGQSCELPYTLKPTVQKALDRIGPKPKIAMLPGFLQSGPVSTPELARTPQVAPPYQPVPYTIRPLPPREGGNMQEDVQKPSPVMPRPSPPLTLPNGNQPVPAPQTDTKETAPQKKQATQLNPSKTPTSAFWRVFRRLPPLSNAPTRPGLHYPLNDPYRTPLQPLFSQFGYNPFLLQPRRLTVEKRSNLQTRIPRPPRPPILPIPRLLSFFRPRPSVVNAGIALVTAIGQAALSSHPKSLPPQKTELEK